MNRAVIFFALLICTACVASQKSGNRLEWKWNPQTSGCKASLRGLCAVNDKVAWASGSGGTCLRTVDGGETWKSCSPPGCESLDFRDVHAFDDQTALLLNAGEPAKIFKTVDGGLHWSVKYHNDTPGIFFDALAFWDAQNGMAFSDPVDGRFFLIETRNGGETWERVRPAGLPRPLDGEAGFAASGSCLAVSEENHVWFATGGSAARVVHSGDRGRSWTAVHTPILSGAPSRGIFSVAFKDALNGVIVGGDYEHPEYILENAAWTDDGGKTWYGNEVSRPNGYRSCVAFIPMRDWNFFVAVGPTGADLSSDGGRTWKPCGGSEGYHCIRMTGSSGWAVGSDGRISRVEIILPHR